MYVNMRDFYCLQRKAAMLSLLAFSCIFSQVETQVNVRFATKRMNNSSCLLIVKVMFNV